MEINFFVNDRIPSSSDFEIVERKGRGHPDTLADKLAEKLSVAYSNYANQESGLILRHQFDKLLLMGGRCSVSFGEGKFNSPIRLVLNGRATARFGDKQLNFRDIIYAECKVFLEHELRNFNFSNDCKVIFETSSNSTRGLIDNTGKASINYRFSPRGASDLPESTRPLANDTALGYGFAPFTPLESLILDIEQSLTSAIIQSSYKWIGSDIKIMGCRIKNRVELTLAIPQVCTELKSINDYLDNSEKLSKIIKDITKLYTDFEVSTNINPSDNPAEDILYLRFTGSCIESGDEGVVGRGNRIGGVISSCRSYSIEGLNGKNPSYHAGKIYSAAAWEIAGRIWNEMHVTCEVFILSQIDKPLDEPWKIILKTSAKIDEKRTEQIVSDILSNLSTITNNILQGYYQLA